MENNQEIIENAELNMMAAIGHLETELAKIRAGKANPVMLKGISVEYYGSLTPLNQVASVSTPNAQTISIQPWEKSIIDEIEKSMAGNACRCMCYVRIKDAIKLASQKLEA